MQETGAYDFRVGCEYIFEKLKSAPASIQNHLSNCEELQIVCRISYSTGLKHYTSVVHGKDDAPERMKKRRAELVSNFQRLRSDTRFGDVTISTPTNVFMAHKDILSSRSTVFDAMFSSSMTETKSHTIEIREFDGEVVSFMLDFIYTGETN